jgi:uncharacterized membrane protein HdeD (DUF308 family)
MPWVTDLLEIPGLFWYLGVLMVATGILILANHLEGAVIFPWIYGVSPLLGGIVSYVAGIKMRS